MNISKITIQMKTELYILVRNVEGPKIFTKQIYYVYLLKKMFSFRKSRSLFFTRSVYGTYTKLLYITNEKFKQKSFLNFCLLFICCSMYNIFTIIIIIIKIYWSITGRHQFLRFTWIQYKTFKTNCKNKENYHKIVK